ncbi:prolipoprotein diacylglyceryl transferase [Lachnotalea sp. AF33-28]|uniref:prolipoprotein diacylglyceryl transferase n=1 Tax=Lachnotalea sp. AF33-28 TaxID=2292046 RepID=UPI000E4C0B7F|nr:prolipoprotein diacylglyceryl transferase [Lachnotalea sp. AF33-28]
MRYILFELGPLKVYSYGFMIALGIIAAFAVADKRAAKYGLSGDTLFSMGLWCLVGGLAGAKLLYVLVEIKAIMENPQNILKELTEGFVVYGGIIGGILTGYIYSRVKKVSFIKYFDLIMPSIALAQAFGRIGCFLSGCCYGCETSSWCGVVFNNSPFAPIGVRVIPTQLISSAANFLHFFVLIWFAKRAKSDGQVGGLYLIFYSIGRFLIEILRNDPRGEIGFLSTSQFISIFTLILGIALFVIATKKWKKMPEPETAGAAGRDVPPAATSAVRYENMAEQEADVRTEEPSKQEADARTEEPPKQEADTQSEELAENEADVQTEETKE